MKQQKEDLQNAFQGLEKIVEELNTRDIDVDTALQKFNEGVELIEFCRSQLKKAENEFKELKGRLDVSGNDE